MANKASISASSRVRAPRRRVPLKVLIACLLLAGCRSATSPGNERTQEATGSPASRPSANMYDVKAHPGATVIHPVDPHTLTDSQIKFGIAPKRDPSVEYQPDIILMENGDKAIKSVGGDGMTWTFDANAPQVSDFQEGKIVFATGRAVGRVLSLKRQGDTVTAILGPVQITDVIRNGDFAMDQPVDLNNMISYVASDFPEPPDTSADASQQTKTSSLRKISPDHVDEQMTVSRVSRSGKWTPASMVKRLADGRQISYRRIGQRWSPTMVRTSFIVNPAERPEFGGPRLQRTSWQRLQMPGIPGVGGIQPLKISEQNIPPPATLGQVPTVDIQDVKATALAGSDGIGVQYQYNKNGLRLSASGYASIRNSGIQFFLHIKNATIQDCGIRINGAVGVKLHLNASSSQEFKVNFHKKLWLPIDLSIPLGGPVPFSLTFNSSFSIDTGFSAKTSVLNAEGDYSFGGGISAGYWGNQWQVTRASDVKANTDLGKTAEGISVGINSLVMGFDVRTMIGIGAFGFSTGVYAGLRFAGTVLRAPDIGFPCRQGTIEAFIDSGVGYSLPGWITDAINFFLSPFTSHKISRAGSLMKGPSFGLFHGNTQIPSNCATPKGGG